MKHPDHSYRGMSDMKRCPSFIADYDCLAHYIDPKYHQLGQKVRVLSLGSLPQGEVDDTMVAALQSEATGSACSRVCSLHHQGQQHALSLQQREHMDSIRDA